MMQHSARGADAGMETMSVRHDAATATGGESTRSPRYGSQRYFWSQSWQRAERLADYDLLVGDDFRPASRDDLFEWLDADED